jgi:hypothetical protein
MQTITTIGLDIAKSVFQVHGVDAAGQVVIRRQLKRRYVLPFLDVLGIQRLALERCPEAIEKLVKLMAEAKSERAQAAAAGAILDRGCGKPTQPADGRIDVRWIVRDKPMSEDEWRRTYVDK